VKPERPPRAAGRWRLWLAGLLGLLVLAFVALRTPDIPAEDLRARYAAPASQFLELEPGFVVHVRDEGPRDASTLFLIHGSNASLHTWEPWVARLRDRFRLVSLDLQGHGLTGPHPGGCYTSACMAATVEAVRARLGIARMGVAGSSMGGGVALAYATRHPERVAALILVASGGAPVKRDGPPPLGFRIAQTPVVRELARHITPRSMIAGTLDKSVSVKAVAHDAAVDRYWELLRHPGNRAATMARFAEPRTVLSAEALAPLRDVPVLILWGAEDALIPVSAAHWFAAALPGARLVVHPAVGHLPQEEVPDRSAADVAAFLVEAGFEPLPD
jgi:pimeloyl-ACP methyl ester carboxylesterase